MPRTQAQQKQHQYNYNKQQVICKRCGAIVRRNHMSRHHESKSCQRVVEQVKEQTQKKITDYLPDQDEKVEIVIEKKTD